MSIPMPTKTLDEVIKVLEYCTDTGCNPNCPYEKECLHMGLGFPKDALYYLKELASQNSAEAVCKTDSIPEMRDNPPLSWDELKQMEGKPVWVEGRTMDDHNGTYKFWCIVGKTDKLDTYIHLREHGYSNWKNTYGDWWQAYRRERK